MVSWYQKKKHFLKKLKSPPIWRGTGQATATPRACYVCSKPTTVCLATTNATDFLYACEAHLSDTGFATELVDPGVAAAAAAKEAVSKEEIERIKAEWEAKEARKKEKDKGKDKDKDSKAKSGGKDAGGEAEMEEGGGKKGAKSPSPSGTSPTAAGSGSGAATPTHKRYSLHRDFFAMRQAEHRRKRQTNQTQELAPRLPGAPRGSLLGWQSVQYSMLLSLWKILYIPRSINNDHPAMTTGSTLENLQHGHGKTWISEWMHP
jgi:AAA-ATPase Vps4-associated protein 1